MTIENGKVVIPVFHADNTESMLETLEKSNIDTSKCCMCGAPIEKVERHPYNFREKFQALFCKKKFYDWNIDGINSKGVICDRGICLFNALHERRDEMIS